MPKNLARLLLSLSLAFLVAGTGSAEIGNLPELGDESGAVISPHQERQIGEEFMRNARRSLAIVEDPELGDYIERLGSRLVKNSDDPGQRFHFFIVDDPTLNAFAVPGGFVGVHTGLILATRTEAELAAVLAHEIAHVTQRHIPRMVSESRRSAGVTAGALLAALLLAWSGQDPSAVEAVLATTSAASLQNQINFTRGFEQEADRIGIALLARSGLDPRAMPAFFERLQAWNRLNDTNLPEFLRTHPITASRISESRNRAETYPLAAGTDNAAFYRIKARIRASAPGNVKELVRGFEKALEENNNSDTAEAERYGLLLALLRDRQLDRARREAAALVEARPAVPAYRMAQADVEMADGKTERALKIYAAALDRNPSSVVLKRRYAEALLETGRSESAIEIVKSLLKQRPEDPALYRMLARALGNAGARADAHRAMAEHYYLAGNPDAAIEQLGIARRFAGHTYEKAAIDARGKEIKDEAARAAKSR